MCKFLFFILVITSSFLLLMIIIGYSLIYVELNNIHFNFPQQYFFTAGDAEIRCWTVPTGACAPEAAGVIHTDFERGFIKAEVCAFDDFKTLSNGTKSMVIFVNFVIYFYMLIAFLFYLFRVAFYSCSCISFFFFIFKC